jgi:hypothetical protein
MADAGASEVTAALRALATLPTWCAALQPERLGAALAAALPEVARGELDLHGCEPRHLRLKDGVWTFQCRVSVAPPGGTLREVWLEGSYRPQATPDVVEDGRVAAFGVGEGSWWLAELGVELRNAPPDTSLPVMPVLMDADRARALLEDAIRAGTARCADLRIAACRPRLMRYARRSRCSVRYELELPAEADGRAWPRVVVAKTYRDRRGANAYRGMRALWDSELSGSSAVAIAEPLAYLPDARVLVQGPVAGERTLKELVCSWVERGTPAARDELDTCMARTARALAALHGCSVGGGETVTLETELAEVRGMLARLAGLFPAVSGAATPLLARVVDLHAEHAADPVRPSHGTFRPAQVLLHQGDVGFIDFDDFCQAEPAFDVARFRGGIREYGMRTLVAAGRGTVPSPAATAATLAALEAVCDGFLAHYAAVTPLSRVRVMLWETIDLLTHVLQAWTRVSPARLLAAMLTLEDHLRRSGLADDSRAGSDAPRVPPSQAA